MTDMSMRRLGLTIFVSMLSALMVISVYALFFDSNNTSFPVLVNDKPVADFRLANYKMIESGKITPVDFTYAANISTPAVVHVRKKYTATASSYSDPFRDFFGSESPFGRNQEPRVQMASGSGVIISEDGYIVTNNHVVSDAEEIEVTLYDKRTLKAKMIGTDPSTDLALIKIEDKNLPVIPFGDSDSAQIGEWVLAVGNPFDLTSTVTAGIVSAKGRNINILRSQSKAPIESFIQTDAAVNPGNSGGALVNTNGELLGINTAIATPTGTYAGYSFAVPVNIVKKVVSDLMKFGVVQRAFLGVSIRDIDSELADELDLKNLYGIYIAGVSEESGAMEAGMKQGDVITKVNGVGVASSSELQEQISRYRPGDKVTVNYLRNGKEYATKVTLKNNANTTEIVEKEPVMALLGVAVDELTSKEKKEYGVEGGVKIKDLQSGILAKNTGVKKGFIITKIDKQPVNSVSEFNNLMERKRKGDGVYLEGFYPDHPWKTYYYAFGI